MVELSVIVLILALFAASSAPNMASAIEGGKRRSFRASTLNLIHQARESAIQSGKTVWLSTDSNGGFQISTTVDEEEQVIKTVDAADGVTVENLTLNGSSAGDGDWKIGFYPDGSSDGGSFELQESNASKTVTVDKRTGRIRVTDGDLDESESPDAEWQAGEYERTGS